MVSVIQELKKETLAYPSGKVDPQPATTKLATPTSFPSAIAGPPLVER